MTEPRWPKWQTIDKAPRDGMDVLLCRKGERSVFIGYWDNRGDLWWIEGGQLSLEPTHFAYLPDALGAPAVGEVA